MLSTYSDNLYVLSLNCQVQRSLLVAILNVRTGTLHTVRSEGGGERGRERRRGRGGRGREGKGGEEKQPYLRRCSYTITHPGLQSITWLSMHASLVSQTHTHTHTHTHRRIGTPVAQATIMLISSGLVVHTLIHTCTYSVLQSMHVYPMCSIDCI